jgi:Flp pilus assembly protein TadG
MVGMKRTFRNGERGQTMAYFVIVLTFVVIPLAVLTVDIVRALYLHAQLQAAADAACEAAAQALDTPTFVRTGARQINLGLGASYAAQAFSGTVANKGIVGYSPALTGISLLSPTVARCTASAGLKLLIPSSPTLNVHVVAVSEMRVNRR